MGKKFQVSFCSVIVAVAQMYYMQICLSEKFQVSFRSVIGAVTQMYYMQICLSEVKQSLEM